MDKAIDGELDIAQIALDGGDGGTTKNR